jgi:hypothetical protein
MELSAEAQSAWVFPPVRDGVLSDKYLLLRKCAGGS